MFDILREFYAEKLVTRYELEKLTGGIVNPQTIARLDSAGQGINVHKKKGRQAAYLIDDVIAWLEKNYRKI